VDTDLEGVVEDEYDYAVRVCVRRVVNVNVGKCEGLRTASRVPRFLRERGRGCREGAVCLCPAEDQSVLCQCNAKHQSGRKNSPPQTLPVS
jgi:hypothetical protein